MALKKVSQLMPEVVAGHFLAAALICLVSTLLVLRWKCRRRMLQKMERARVQRECALEQMERVTELAKKQILIASLKISEQHRARLLRHVCSASQARLSQVLELTLETLQNRDFYQPWEKSQF